MAVGRCGPAAGHEFQGGIHSAGLSLAPSHVDKRLVPTWRSALRAIHIDRRAAGAVAPVCYATDNGERPTAVEVRDQHVRRLITVNAPVLAVCLALAGCTGSNDEPKPSAQGTKTAVPVPAGGEESSSPGRLRIAAATASTSPETAAFVFDHDLQKGWNSGAGVPGWIQLDLGRQAIIGKLRLYTEQTPPGPTTHQILGGNSPDTLVPLGTLDGETAGGQWLEIQVKGLVRYVRVITVKSPSWVGWRELEVWE